MSSSNPTSFVSQHTQTQALSLYSSHFFQIPWLPFILLNKDQEIQHKHNLIIMSTVVMFCRKLWCWLHNSLSTKNLPSCLQLPPLKPNTSTTISKHKLVHAAAVSGKIHTNTGLQRMCIYVHSSLRIAISFGRGWLQQSHLQQQCLYDRASFSANALTPTSTALNFCTTDMKNRTTKSPIFCILLSVNISVSFLYLLSLVLNCLSFLPVCKQNALYRGGSIFVACC